MDFGDDTKTIAGGALRLFAALLLSTLVGLLIFNQVIRGGDPSEAANENSPIELVQLALLLLSAALTAVAAWKRKEWREGVVLVGAFFLCMSIRECDKVFDELFFHGAWQPFAFGVAATGVAMAFRRRGRAAAGLAAIVRDRSFGLVCAGLCVVFAFSRILGYKRIWLAIYRDICGEEHAIELCRAMKNIAEEGTELFGYALVFLWAVAFATSALVRRRQASNAPTEINRLRETGG